MKAILENILASITEKTKNYFFIKAHRLRESAFTRVRSLSFQKVMFMKLDTQKQSNNNAVYNVSMDVFNEKPTSRQSFEQARNNISHTAFKELFEDTVKSMTNLPNTKLYKGYRLLGVDGTTNSLAKSDELKDVFGKSTPVEGSIYCRISFCADLLNEFILDGRIAGYDTGERALAMEHLENIDCPNGLFICDRGYWSKIIIEKLCADNRRFLFRVQSNHAPSICEGNSFIYMDKYSLRYHKFTLESGETEHLVTNLESSEITDCELEELYALRWGIETRINEFKNQIGFIRYSGKSELTVLQDFYASLTVMNLICAAIYDANCIVQEQRKDKEMEYRYKPNKTSAINILKNRYLRAALEQDERKKELMFSMLIKDISKSVIPIRPGRHFPRRIFTGKHRVSNF